MKNFFDQVRRLFGPLKQSQVDGFNNLIPAIRHLPLAHQAYILATVWHEVDTTMQPIEEYGKGRGKKYGVPDGPYKKVYYGRGLVQITWLDNYVKADKRLKELGLLDKKKDLVKNPELVLDPQIAVPICVIGMTEGWFTGKKLSDYTTYKGMRYVVNGQDDADLIASYAQKFERAALELADDQPAVVTPPKPEPIPVPVPEKKRVSTGVAAAVAAIVAAFIAIVIAMVKGGFSP